MDNIPEISPVFWMITTAITTLSSVVLGIITWVKSAKLMPKELTKADLENRKAEVSLADQYEIMATRAAEKAVNMQSRLTKNEEDIASMKAKIQDQSEIIKAQSIRLDAQDKKITDQEAEIFSLGKELNLAKAYNTALISQMKKENLVPLEISEINVDDYKSEITPKRKYSKKQQDEK